MNTEEVMSNEDWKAYHKWHAEKKREDRKFIECVVKRGLFNALQDAELHGETDTTIVYKSWEYRLSITKTNFLTET